MIYLQEKEYKEILFKIQKENKINTVKNIGIYTDGSCKINNGDNPGTHGVIILINNKVIYTHSDHNITSTNNREELFALVKAACIANYIALNSQFKVKIYTDSQYAKNTLFGSWKKKKNMDIFSKYKGFNINKNNFKVIHIYGHNGNYGNEIVDALCNQEYDNINKF